MRRPTKTSRCWPIGVQSWTTTKPSSPIKAGLCFLILLPTNERLRSKWTSAQARKLTAKRFPLTSFCPRFCLPSHYLVDCGFLRRILHLFFSGHRCSVLFSRWCCSLFSRERESWSSIAGFRILTPCFEMHVTAGSYLRFSMHRLSYLIRWFPSRVCHLGR